MRERGGKVGVSCSAHANGLAGFTALLDRMARSERACAPDLRCVRESPTG